MSFASDNFSGCHPKVLEALAECNVGHAPAYGADAWTEKLQSRVHEVFGAHAFVLPVFGGTGANVVGLSLLVKSFEAVICTQSAHIQVDECGAPEKFLGSKLIALPGVNGKLTPQLIKQALTGVGVQHHVQPRAVSITQSTELGTVYTPGEIRAISALLKKNNLFLHMDGARISNAAASLGCSLREITADAGVDVLSFGGTKNGLMGAEAVVVLDVRRFGDDALFRRKQAMQLPSKSRFISAQLLALLSDGLWQANARHANAMARLLESRVRDCPGLEVRYPVEANAVFARMPQAAVIELQKKFSFYIWEEGEQPTVRPTVRWMTSFDTAEDHVTAFAQAVQSALVN